MAAAALACPACSALVHREKLQQLASLAADAATAGDPGAAKAHWQEAQGLVPIDSEQHRLIGARLAGLADPVDVPRFPSGEGGRRAWWKPALGATATVGLLLVGKLKFLLLGLSKLSTLFSMFGFIAVYWSIHGWPLAVGIALSIYVHEMGHVSMLRRLGISANAPLFIPGVGALIMLKQHVTDPVIDARIGLAGPVWGLSTAIVAWLVYLMTRADIWLAIAELTAFLNLFNLIPIWQLDGARGFHALSRQERWMIVSAIAVALWVTGVRMLWIVGAVAIFQTVRADAGPGHRPTLLTFGALVFALAWFARAVG
jgi:Zn-dependent protease